jgi:hypothetical protein
MKRMALASLDSCPPGARASARVRGPRRSAPGLALALALTALVTGCGDDGSVGAPPAGGYLGQATVEPDCGALSQACLQNGMDAPLAVGASMGIAVDYAFEGNAGPPTTLETVNDGVLAVDDAVIRGVSAGPSALLIVGPDGEVIDFIHLWVAQATDLEIVRHNTEGAVMGTVNDSGTLLVGDELLLSVEAFSETQGLLGLFETTWEIEVDEGEEPILVVDDLVYGWFRLVARSEGQARITVTALGATRVLDLEVLP